MAELNIDFRKMPNPGRHLYSYALQDAVERQLPKSVLDALANCGWNAIGVYELVKFALAAEKRANRADSRRHHHGE